MIMNNSPGSHCRAQKKDGLSCRSKMDHSQFISMSLKKKQNNCFTKVTCLNSRRRAQNQLCKQEMRQDSKGQMTIFKKEKLQSMNS